MQLKGSHTRRVRGDTPKFNQLQRKSEINLKPLRACANAACTCSVRALSVATQLVQQENKQAAPAPHSLNNFCAHTSVAPRSCAAEDLRRRHPLHGSVSIMALRAAVRALCISLACAPAAVLATSYPHKSTRSLKGAKPVEVPGTFNAGDVVNAKKDLVLLKPDKFGYFGTIVLGSSAVYTLNVAKAGTYPVIYALTGTCCTLL